MSDGSGEIIIKGGSCEIHFDPTLYAKDDSDPRMHRHTNDRMRITKIVMDGRTLFEGKDRDDGYKGEIRISCAY
jgi:hypothetical protein